MVQRRKRCDRQFKVSAAKVVLSGETTVKDLSEELGIKDSTLGRWACECEEVGDGAFPGNGSPKINEDHEIVKLEKKVEPGDPRLNLAERAFTTGERNRLWVGGIAWHGPVGIKARHVAGQRGGRAVLQDAERGIGGREEPWDEGRGQAGHLQAHRALLQ